MKGVYENKLVNASIILMGVFLVFFLFEKFQSFMRPFTLALLLMFLFLPVTRLSKQKKITLALLSLLVVALLVSVLSVVATLALQETAEVGLVLPESQHVINENIHGLLSRTNVTIAGRSIDVTKVIAPEKITSYLAKVVSNTLVSVIAVFSQLLLVMLFLLFLLPAHSAFVTKISSHIQPKKEKNFRSALVAIEESIRNYLISKTLVSLGTALVSLIIMFAFDVKFLIIFAIIIFILNFIPNIGSFIAVALVIIVQAILLGLSPQLFILLGLLIAVQFLFGSIIEPKFTGHKLELSPVVILLSLMFWGSIWGMGGMLMAVPLTSITKIIFEKIGATNYIAEYLE